MLFILCIPFCNSTKIKDNKTNAKISIMSLCRREAKWEFTTNSSLFWAWWYLWSLKCCSFFAEKNHLIEQKSNLQIKQPKQSKFKAKQRSAIEFTWFLRITLCLFHLLDCAYLQFLERRANILKSSSMALYEGKRNYKIINNVKLCKAPWTLNQSWFVPMEALLSSQLFDPR